MKPIRLLTLLFLTWPAFWTRAEETISASGPVKIKNVSLDKKTFRPEEGETVSIRYLLTGEAEVRVRLFDRRGRPVKSLLPGRQKEGANHVSWDGKDENGVFAVDPVIVYVIETGDKEGNVSVYDPRNETAGWKLEARDFIVDGKGGRIEYVLPKAAMVRIRAGLKQGPMLHNLLDWQPQEAGRHVLAWDGRDGSGNFSLLENQNLELNLRAYTLADNSIIVKRPGRTGDGRTAGSRSRPGEMQGTDFSKDIHYYHHPADCHAPRFAMDFPKAKRGDDGIPVLAGAAPVRIAVVEEDAAPLIDRRFEVMFYVDGVYLFEIEEGSNPLTYCWDTRAIKPGEHLLTVNVLSYDDHLGVVTKRIRIEPE